MKFFTKIAGQSPGRKHFKLRLFLAVCVAGLFSGNAFGQLSGTYTVCYSGCNYSTIQKAADDLKSQGISGLVTISIKSGDYNEQVSIGAINGVSASKTVTFKGAGAKNTDVWVHSASGTALTVTGAKWITFDNLHIETQNYSSGSFTLNITKSKNINVLNCRLTGQIASPANSGHHLVNVQSDTTVLLKNCYMRGGYNGIYDSGSGKNLGLSIEGSQLTNFYNAAVYLNGNTNTSYLLNTVDSSTSASPYAAFFTNADSGRIIFKGNTINQGGTLPIYITTTKKLGSWVIDSNFILKGNSGIYAYLTSAGLKFQITRNRISNQSVAMQINAYDSLEISNNIIDVPSTGSIGIYTYIGSFTSVIRILHNTLYLGGTSNAGIYFYNLLVSAKNVSILNNAVQGAGTVYNFQGLVAGNKVDGNAIYSSAAGTFATVNGTAYSSFATSNAAIKSISGWGADEQNTKLSFIKVPSDLHLDHTNPAPFGVSAGLAKDYDGDLRCLVMPTSGADETKNTSGDNYKSISGTKFTGPSKTYNGSPTSFFNSATGSATRMKYRWYVNGKKVSDSFNLLNTTSLTYPKSCVKLEAYNCAKSDTFVMCITVDSPTVAPTTDFIADKTFIRAGDTVSLSDLSSGYPSAWAWDITPVTGIIDGSLKNAYQYAYGYASSPNVRVRFDVPGKYKVCMTASNMKGKGGTECKSDYIEVLPYFSVNKPGDVTKNPAGLIYDNGGPEGNTRYAYNNQPRPSLTIDACADSVYLVFRSFSVNCAQEYVRIYQGTNNGGSLLTCSKNTSGGYGPGLTGSVSSSFSCTTSCSPIRTGSLGNFVYDTFRAATAMYIEMESNSSGSPGFEAYYWIKPKSVTKPKASFTVTDSICVNGLVNFNNTTTGSEVKYYWDLDGDRSTIEETSKSPWKAYFAPGTYKVTLIATNCGGTDSFSKSIVVFTPKRPVANFKADNQTPTVDDIVFLSPNMPMCVDAYRWTITPNGNLGKATFVNGTTNKSANPQVKFDSVGCYDVKLYTRNVSGEDSLEVSCYIKVRAPYCKPSVTNKAADLGISKVVFNTINNTSTQGDAYTSYVNDPSKSTTVQKGETHDLTVARITNNNKITRTAWIDWNIDGVFDTAKEKVGFQVNSTSMSWTTSVSVPSTAKTGATVLRVASNIGSQSNDPCGPNSYGEFEDYRVYVTEDVTKPVLKLKGEDSVKVEMCDIYTDSGATAFDNVNGDVTSRIRVNVTPTFNNNIAGTYVWKYTVSDNVGNKAEAVRIVTVLKDTTPPEIVLFNPDTTYMEVFDPLAKDSAVAYDCGGTVLTNIKVKGFANPNILGTYTLEYSSTDMVGNTATRKRVIIVEDKIVPVLTLVGKSPLAVDVNSSYTDPGVTIADNYYSDSALRVLLIVKSNVDITKPGVYTVEYILTDPSGNGPVSVKRTVIVEDLTAPVLAMKGDNPYKMDGNSKYKEPGVTVTDNYDATVKYDSSGTFYASFPTGYANKLGTFTINYFATDAAGNSASITRTIIVQDTTRPVANLIGLPTVTLCRWQVYTDEGVEVSDNFYPKTGLTVEKEGSFMLSGTQKPGLFSLRYKVTDGSGNVAYSLDRSIVVQEPNTGPCTTGFTDGDNLDKLIAIYPNPTSGKLIMSLSTPLIDPVKIMITNSLGQQVAAAAGGLLNTGTYAIDLSSQASGVYLVTVQTGAKSITKKVILAR